MESRPTRRRFHFLPAFWTVASVISITVNIILIILLLATWQMIDEIKNTTISQTSGLLGGLYSNFVKMDKAAITRTIPVDANIPLHIVSAGRAPSSARASPELVVVSRLGASIAEFHDRLEEPRASAGAGSG